MKIDLNAAAYKWGGYTAGQVIKHGTEARNTKNLASDQRRDSICNTEQCSIFMN